MSRHKTRKKRKEPSDPLALPAAAHTAKHFFGSVTRTHRTLTPVVIELAVTATLFSFDNSSARSARNSDSCSCMASTEKSTPSCPALQSSPVTGNLGLQTLVKLTHQRFNMQNESEAHYTF